MAYNEAFADRIRQILFEKEVLFTEKKMFSGLCFLLDDKLLCGTHIDKKQGDNVMLCRIGEQEYEPALEKEFCIPMNFTGKTMKGYVYVLEDGLRTMKELRYWLELCINYNPIAKKAKK